MLPGVKVRQIREGELQALIEAAAADRHVVLGATHVVEKEGQICGYLSLGVVPVVNCWMDSKRLKVRDSVQVFNTLDSLMEQLGMPRYLMPCAEDSPFREYMGKADYEPVCDTTLFLKKG
jgi:hypothetical protein